MDQLQKQGIGKDLFVQSGLPAEICRIREALDTTLPETLRILTRTGAGAVVTVGDGVWVVCYFNAYHRFFLQRLEITTRLYIFVLHASFWTSVKQKACLV